MNKLHRVMARKGMHILIGAVLICTLILPAIPASPVLAWTTYPLQPNEPEVVNALNYLRGQQQADGMIGSFETSAWVVMAIAAAGENPHNWKKVGANPSIVDYLEANAAAAANVMDYERMILAITAAGRDPNSFGGRNFVALVEAAYDGTQIGDNTLLNDDFWGIIALISAGKSQNSAIIQNSATFIKNKQQPDNGWAFDVAAAFGTDVDSTAAAIMALIAAGDGPNSAAITDGFQYMQVNQAANGGFLSWGATNADTDSWAISAIKSAGQNPTGANWTQVANTPIHDLVSLQQGDGSFNWQAGNPGWDVPKTTACAIIALVGKFYPVRVFQSTSTGEESIAETVNYGTPAAAVQAIESLSSGEAAKLLTTVGKKDRAGQILGQVNLDKRTDIILEMGEQSLKEILPEVAPDRLFEVSPEKLFDKLPDVPTEQLIGEVPPSVPSDLPGSEKLASTPTSAGYLAPEARAGEWVSFFSGSIYPFTSLMLKTNKDLTDVEASVKILNMRPAGVKLPSGYPYLSLYYDIALENIEAQDMEAARLTFRLKKEILDFMGHNKWSILFNRWDEETQEWVPIPTKRIGDDSQFAYYSTVVPGFSIFSITGSRDIPSQTFESSNLAISPAEATAGDEVIITADITNTTDKSKSYTAILWLNQMAEQVKEVEIPAGETTRVSFTIVKHTLGEYRVRIDKQMGSFIVGEAPDTVPPEITSCYPTDITKQTKPVIGARYYDDGDGINAATTKLMLDGEDVTLLAEVTDSEVSYCPLKELGEGEHTVRISIADMAGNESFKEWSFIVRGTPVFTEQATASRDLDGDGLYEDVNGDGKFDLHDVALLYDNIDSELVRTNTELFDFDQNGSVDRDDVRKLLVEIYKKLSF